MKSVTPFASCVPVVARMTLDEAGVDEALEVRGVEVGRAPAEWATWLADIGFVPGERVTVLRRAALGGDRLVARIGLSTFALRRAEAACIRVAAAGAA